MDIELEKDFLSDLKRSSEIEWLEKNDFGIYSSSSCIGMNTRREHGLFVVPDNSLKKKVVLLSKFEESIFIENRLHEVSTNSYDGGVFPSGYSYCNKFYMNPFPKLTYEIENRVLEKTVFLMSDEPILVVRYELKNHGIPINLIIKPFLADRFSTELTRELQGLNTDSYLGTRFVRWSLKQNMPEIYVYFSRGEFVPANLWYKNFTYPKDRGKYADIQTEHLFNPGFFQTSLDKYQTFELYISTKELDESYLNYESMYRKEVAYRKSKSLEFFREEDELLRLSGTVSKVKPQNENDPIPVSTMENLYTTRDIIFSLPGIYFTNENYGGFKKEYTQLAGQISEGLLPVYSPLMREQNHYSAADLSLWLVNLGYSFLKLTNDDSLFENGIFDKLKSIFDAYIKGTLNNIYMDKDYLIFCGNRRTSVSWIPLISENNEVLRYGKLLEVNALWYNALMAFGEIGEKIGKKRKISKYLKIADKVKESFNKTFLINNFKLVDFVNNESQNSHLRVNQIIPMSLPFCPIKQDVCLKILDQIDKDLLTPFGLRSAQNSENGDEQVYTVNRKTSSYYAGAIWPWTTSLYIDAAINCSNDAKTKAKYLLSYFSPLLNQMNKGLINNLPEIITYNGYAYQKGIADYTTTAATVLWSYYKLKKELF